jgi:hypothetical protein
MCAYFEYERKHDSGIMMRNNSSGQEAEGRDKIFKNNPFIFVVPTEKSNIIDVMTTIIKSTLTTDLLFGGKCKRVLLYKRSSLYFENDYDIRLTRLILTSVILVENN